MPVFGPPVALQNQKFIARVEGGRCVCFDSDALSDESLRAVALRSAQYSSRQLLRPLPRPSATERAVYKRSSSNSDAQFKF